MSSRLEMAECKRIRQVSEQTNDESRLKVKYVEDVACDQ